MRDLEIIRTEIDALDDQLAVLYEKRMALSVEVGAFKRKHDLPVYDSKRETVVLEKCKERISNPALKDGFAQVMTLVMDQSKRMQGNF